MPAHRSPGLMPWTCTHRDTHVGGPTCPFCLSAAPDSRPRNEPSRAQQTPDRSARSASSTNDRLDVKPANFWYHWPGAFRQAANDPPPSYSPSARTMNTTAVDLPTEINQWATRDHATYERTHAEMHLLDRLRHLLRSPVDLLVSVDRVLRTVAVSYQSRIGANQIGAANIGDRYRKFGILEDTDRLGVRFVA